MIRVLIVNADGLLAAMPTQEEYRASSYNMGDVRVLGLVECPNDLSVKIYGERSRVRVLLPEYPSPSDVEGAWLWISVINGLVVLL